jgi:hypothetical protein
MGLRRLAARRHKKHKTEKEFFTADFAKYPQMESCPRLSQGLIKAGCVRKLRMTK